MQDYITESNRGLIDYLVVTSAEFWDGLPVDIRTGVKKALDEAIAHGNKVALDKAVSDRKLIMDSGHTKFLQLSDAARKKWVEAMKPVWKKFEDQIGKNFIDAAVASNVGS